MRAEAVKDGGSCRVDDVFFIHHLRGQCPGYSLTQMRNARLVDAEHRGLHSHVERGNDQILSNQRPTTLFQSAMYM